MARYRDLRNQGPADRERERDPHDRFDPRGWGSVGRIDPFERAIQRGDVFRDPRARDYEPPGVYFDPFVPRGRFPEIWVPMAHRPSRRPSVSPPRERAQPAAPPRIVREPPRERTAGFHAEHTVHNGRESSSGEWYYAESEKIVYPNGRSLEYQNTRRDKDWTELWVETAIYYKNGKETHRASELHITKSDLPNASPLFVRKASQQNSSTS